jgi:hypothetical protein
VSLLDPRNQAHRAFRKILPGLSPMSDFSSYDKLAEFFPVARPFRHVIWR